MNISHTSDNEHQHNDECEDTKAFLNKMSAKDSVNCGNSAIAKVLELLDDTTPNYVLGYN
ncbi:hypothetical protein [Thalassomonas haliotis]|uniref:Uncharacterized protein n=1 Tax=Thalassomonas haliotis TaxID=485448 RepID=A0ABY7V7I2_9GAMM|nr:hypothetical protein [Thalassomonas haliotis]WDE09556.1 hypothetical protein H3N35_14545 [Thalassomonas haliotis]